MSILFDSMQCNVCTAYSSFVRISGLAKPEQKLSLNAFQTQNSKLNIENKKFKAQI